MKRQGLNLTPTFRFLIVWITFVSLQTTDTIAGPLGPIQSAGKFCYRSITRVYEAIRYRKSRAHELGKQKLFIPSETLEELRDRLIAHTKEQGAGKVSPFEDTSAFKKHIEIIKLLFAFEKEFAEAKGIDPNELPPAAARVLNPNSWGQSVDKRPSNLKDIPTDDLMLYLKPEEATLDDAFNYIRQTDENIVTKLKDFVSPKAERRSFTRAKAWGITFVIGLAGYFFGDTVWPIVRARWISSWLEPATAEVRQSGFGNSLSGTGYDPKAGLNPIETRWPGWTQISKGEEQVSDEFARHGRYLGAFVMDGLNGFSSSLDRHSHQGNQRQIWLTLSNLYNFRHDFREVFNHDQGLESKQIFENLFKTYDPEGTVKKALESGHFKEAYQEAFGPEN